MVIFLRKFIVSVPILAIEIQNDPEVSVVQGSSQLSMGKGRRGTFFRLRQKQITSFYFIIIKLF